MKKLQFITVVLVSMAMLVSCASPTAAPVVSTAAPVAEGPVEIAVIVKTGNSSFWQNVQTGAMDAQKEL